MKRREPFFKKTHNAWYVEFDRKQIRLSTDEKEAWDKYHELMTARKKAAKFVATGELAPLTLGDLRDQFLASDFKGKSDQTRQWYADKLSPFVSHYSHEFPVAELKPFHIQSWAAAHPDWSAGTVRNLWRAVQRLCRWGHRMGLIPELAVLHQEKPKAGRREVVITPEQYAQLLTFLRNDTFRNLVIIAWQSGARPQELLSARVRHLDTANQRLVFPPHESKDKDRPRIIYLTDVAFELIRPKGKVGPDDHLLKNSEGRPWTAARRVDERSAQPLGGVPHIEQADAGVDQGEAAVVLQQQAVTGDGGVRRDEQRPAVDVVDARHCSSVPPHAGGRSTTSSLR